MSKRTQENLVAGVLLLVFVAFLVVGTSYSPKARLVPVPLSIVAILLISLQLVLQNLKTDLKLNVDTMDLFANPGASDDDEPKEEAVSHGPSARKEWEGIGIVLLFLAMIMLVGMMPAVLLYVFGYFVLLGREQWFKALIYAGVTTGILYMLFVKILQILPYEGLLGSFM